MEGKPEVKTEIVKEENDGKDTLQIIDLPIDLCFHFFWSTLHSVLKNYSYTKKQPASGRFPLMREIYLILFDEHTIEMEKQEIEERIPESFRKHAFFSGSTCHWTRLTWKYDATKQFLSASVHYEVKCVSDGIVKWFGDLLFFTWLLALRSFFCFMSLLQPRFNADFWPFLLPLLLS